MKIIFLYLALACCAVLSAAQHDYWQPLRTLLSSQPTVPSSTHANTNTTTITTTTTTPTTTMGTGVTSITGPGSTPSTVTTGTPVIATGTDEKAPVASEQRLRQVLSQMNTDLQAMVQRAMEGLGIDKALLDRAQEQVGKLVAAGAAATDLFATQWQQSLATLQCGCKEGDRACIDKCLASLGNGVTNVKITTTIAPNPGTGASGTGNLTQPHILHKLRDAARRLGSDNASDVDRKRELEKELVATR